MPKNRSAQGKGYEREVIKIMEAEGWTVEQAINKTIFIGPGRIISVAHDFFGLWDLMCIKGNTLLFIQVTVWEHASDKRRKIEKSPLDWAFMNSAVYARMRGVRPLHYRIMENQTGYQWTGKTAQVIK